MDHTGSSLTQARVPQFFPEGACVVAVDRAVCALSTDPKPGGLDCPEATRPRVLLGVLLRPRHCSPRHAAHGALLSL